MTESRRDAEAGKVTAVERVLSQSWDYVDLDARRQDAEAILDAIAATGHPSPQGEDHKAGIEAATDVLHTMFCASDCHEPLNKWRPNAEQIIAAYLSRCPSPERDLEAQSRGWRASSAAQYERAERLAKVLRELVRLKDGPRDDTYRATKDAAWQEAREALAEFDPKEER